MSVSKTVVTDADNHQLHRIRCTFASAGNATVVEIVGGLHVPRACTLMQVHGYGVSGTCSNYQIDIHEATASQSSVPAGSAKVFEGLSTAKSDQSNTAKIGGMIALDSGRSLYVRLQPDAGSDNAATVDCYFVPTVGGQ